MPKREMSVAKVVMVGGRVVAVLEQDKYVVPDWFPLALRPEDADRIKREVSEGKLKKYEDG